MRGLMSPAREIGGDYYDFIVKCGQECDLLGVVIGDVSGEGVAAGFIMAMAKTAVHSAFQEGLFPKGILLRTHRILYEQIKGEAFMRRMECLD